MDTDGLQLYIVATPIGNLEDITYRAIRVLSDVDIILCEDTRTTQKLLDHYEIKAKTESYNAHTSEAKSKKILESIGNGVRYALVSDAGTPTISDPGVKLIEDARTLYQGHLHVIPIPGATALIAGLSITGFTGNQFTFYGFIPHKKGRVSLFNEMIESERISIFYESPHRITKTLDSLYEIMGQYSERKICIARELTKIYEQGIVGTINDIRGYFQHHPDHVKGEFVVILDKK